MSTISMIPTATSSDALGTPREYAQLFAPAVSAHSAVAAGVANADGARKWGRPPRGTPR